jgi:hypothetical protein
MLEYIGCAKMIASGRLDLGERYGKRISVCDCGMNGHNGQAVAVFAFTDRCKVLCSSVQRTPH